jgi:subtilisin-like proprotein convertase family protein
MRRKIWILTVVCLLALAAAWFYWPQGGRVAVAVKNSAAPAALAGSAAATKAAAVTAPKTFSVLNTNALAFRLGNTPKSLSQLAGTPHAILLANALIDTDARLDLKIPSHLRSAGNPGAFIVQARGPVDAQFRAVLAAAGAQIVSYIPNNAYLVRISLADAGALAGSPLVQAVLPYEPYYKLQPSLLGLAVAQEPLPPGTALNLGLFAADAPATELILEKLGAKIIGRDRSAFGPVLRVLAPADWTALAQLPGVQILEPAHQRVAANDLSRVTLGVSPDTTSGSTNDWLGLTGLNVLVAVNDTGIDATHPDFTATGTAAGGPAGPTRVIPNDSTDTDGHGTHVAGIIAGNGAMSINPTNVGSLASGSVTNADFRGKAPLATLFSMNMNRSDQNLQEAAAQTNALISNNSWDYGRGAAEYDLAAASYDAATRDARPFTTGSQPVLFVFAAGNNGGGNSDGAGGSADTIMSPGTAKNVITVGALEQLRNITNIVTMVTGGVTNKGPYWQPQTDSGSQVAFYSSRGNVGVGTEGSFGRFKPDVVAPGNFVVSTRSAQWDTNAYYNPTNGQRTDYTFQIVATNSLVYYSVSVPPNAISVVIGITANKHSPSPFPANLPIYVQQSGFPDPVNAPGSIDITTTKDGISIPSDSGGAITGIQAIQNNGFSFAVGNSNNISVNYDLFVEIRATNNVGDRYQVLEGMNDRLGGSYRYESGTSMAAAAVSGVLALMQDFFTNKLSLTPSPALLKAMLINGSRSVGSYTYGITNGNNFQGWGLPSLPNSLPLTSSNLTVIPNGVNPMPLFFVDQSPTNALATGDAHTYLVTLNTNSDAQFLQLQATLVWTDPPGDPAAAIKLVNNLDLVITNLDTLEVYFGNDISPDVGYNRRWNTNAPPNLDTINNVENILLPPLLAGSYSVTVVGRAVNVNAVTAHTNNVVQDYALVISCGEGEVPDALTVTDIGPGLGLVSNPTTDQLITFVTSTNSPLFNQFVGANTPLLGTNNLPLGTNTVWGPNGVVRIGMTNQWHFYVVTNTGLTADVTNAAFITFNPDTLSIPRMGVYESSVANATRPEADIDLYATTDSGLTNLNPVAISNCLAGAVNSRASLGQGGTEFVFYTNSTQGQVYYIGVKSEDQMASEYAFLPVFTSIPFSQLDQNGNQIVNGLVLPVNIPDGNNAHPGVVDVFALAVLPMDVEKVTVINLDEHQNFGDLFGALTFGGQSVVLNNHDGLGNTFGTVPLIYDDSRNPVAGTQPSDGPGNLMNFQGMSALGPWILSVMDNSLTLTGRVSQFSLLIQPHRDLTGPGIIITVPAGGWFIDYVDVPPGYTNLTFFATNLPPTAVPPLQMYEKLGNEPTLTDYDQRADLTNCIIGSYPSGTDPGNSISVGPPLDMGRYFVGLYNPGLIAATNVFLSATLGINSSASDIYNYTASSGQTLFDDAISASTIAVPLTVTQLVASVNVGLVVNSPRISDYAFTLVSPTGQRVLLMENRGGWDTNGAGAEFVYTNILNSTATGGAAANTNYLTVSPLGGTVPITYNFYTVPDRMTVYQGTIISGVNLLKDTGFTNNPPAGGGAQNTIPATINVPYPPGYTNITIIMNQDGNPFASGGDAWIYTAGAAVTNYQYLVFTDDTNLATVPIKFAEPPYNFTASATNYVLSDFELATNGDYFGLTTNLDGWTVPTNLVTYTTIVTNNQFQVVTNVTMLTNNLVSVVTDPADSVGDNVGSNFLALAKGTITRLIPTIPGRLYNVTFWYRGPGIAGWWRGEGDASDSSDPENNDHNGVLVGRFNFPAGEVGQAFQFEDQGDQFGFAGTNTYVQIPQSPSLDVGKGGGFTIEGWINPTNLVRPQPLVEWLAHVPTNTAVTNIVIQAGPYLNRATGHYYYLLGATNWTTSERWATQLGGHLATIDTANEQNWVFDNFADYGGVNRNLWIGLTNNAAGNFVWSSGLTNITYTNWLTGQPLNCDGIRNYTFIRGETNLPSGLWVLANTNGFVCGSAATNKIYGVVEVNEIQTNGVQFWISVTNSMSGGTNTLVSSNGCLYANIMDTNFVSHEIFSAPGLLQSNVYQHVALTYNTNNGLAALYLNGTNVAVTNLGVFVPKTDGDVLLGRDMTRYTNNFYGGTMDEMSIYSRALSLAEISAIYHVSASTTNRLIGKFDPSVTPAVGLAEAEVSFGTTSNLIFGVNNQWEVNSFTFTATSNSMPLQITGLEPGILLDSFAVSEAPETNLYYLPEQALAALNGNSAAGPWTLQVWDNRVGAYVTNFNELVNWQLSFVLQSNATIAATLAPQTPTASTVPPGQTVYYSVTVPSWAQFATNILVSSTYPVDLLFNPTNPPTGSNPGDITLLTASTGGNPAGVSQFLTVNAASPFAPYQAGSSYYLGVRNNGIHAASVVLEVDYDITALTNGVPYTSFLNTNDAVRYFSFDVSSNAYEATFQLLKLSSNADLVLRKGPPLPTLTSSDYGSFNVSNLDENIFVLTNSSPVPLSAGRWYLGVIKRDSGVVNYTILAKELDVTNAPPAIIDLTNGVPFNWTAGPGAALTNFFRFHATNSVVGGVTNYLQGLRFELYNLSGNGDLTMQTNAPPLSPPFFQTSQNPGRSAEMILIQTNSALTNLAADWYLGVPNREVTNITYTIIAVIETNSYFPAFPGAAGSGGGAAGSGGGAAGSGGGAVGAGHAGVNSTVYHVTTTSDAGPGSLRAAVNATNRTVVFDISGTINLLSPLVITNSYLTIAGQTAPGGGITVAGDMTTVQSAHDVVIRFVRFRTGNVVANPVLAWSNGFEGGVGSPTPAAGSYFAGGWLVDFGNIEQLTNGIFGIPYQGGYFIDINGGVPGGVSTNVTTVPGTTYTLNLAYTRNPNGGSEKAGVIVNGQTLGILSPSYANSFASLNWQTTSFVFTATSPLTHLAFMSTNTPGPSGVFLDAVSLTTNVAANPVLAWSNGFEGAAVGNYVSGVNPAFDTWTVISNQVTVIADPTLAYAGSNLLALADGQISRILPTVAGRTYTLSYAYRGPGAVGMWRGEANANDSIYGNNPTNVQGITYATGKVGQAFSFDGSTSLVTMPPSTNLAVTSVTIDSWIYPTTTTYEPIVEYGGAGQFTTISFWVNGWGLTPAPGTLYGQIRPSNPTMHSAAGIVPQNTWSHVAYTFNAGTGILLLYYNGIQVASSPSGPPSPTFVPVNLGYHDSYSSDVYQGRRFAGGLDETTIYNRALSASEIKAIYNHGSAGKFDPAAPSVTTGLAEAQVTVDGSSSPAFFGSNTNWQTTSITFTATQSNTVLQIAGIEPGMLLDAVSLTTSVAANVNPGDSLQFLNASNVIADHISASWSPNNLVSVLGSTNITVQWSIMADSLYDTNNPHGFGSLLRYGSGALSFHHNLYADNYNGSPRLGDNISLDFVNNVIYNWGIQSGFSSTNDDLLVNPNGFTNQLNYVCNYLIAGADTAAFATNFAITNIAFVGGTTNTWIFQTNNFIDSNTNRILDGGNTQWAMFTNKYTPFGRSFPLIPVPTDEAFLAYEKVLDFAGPAMGQRDPVDTNIITKVRNQSGRLISTAGTLPALISTLPYLDTDQDGIPDYWEITFGGNPTNVSNNLDRDGDGYTDLEEYLNWLAAPHALTVTNTPVSVDLLQLCGKTGNLSFAATNGVNGFVYLTNVLGSVTNTGPFSNSIAVFMPTNSASGGTNFYGYASFDIYVTNTDTVAYFGPVTVSVMVSAVPVVYATSNTNSITNSPPVLSTNLPGQIINELTTLTVTNTATDTNAGVTLTYTLTMAIDTNAMIANGWPLNYATTTPSPVISANGIITWTPSEAQGPGVYIITTIVTDNSVPPLSATNSFTVTVNEVNTAPFWPPNVPSQTNYTVAALNLLVVTNTATDSDIPVNPLTYQLLVSPAAANAIINPTNGIITWTPTVAQAPGLYIFTTIVTDTNAFALVNKSLSATNVFTVLVTPVAAPFVFTQPAQSVTGNNAQLNGMATPNGLPATAWFEWGTNTLYGNQTPPVSVGAGYNVVYTPNQISGLVANVPYHFRLVVSNALAVVYGFDQILDEANVVVWGANYVGQATVPSGLSNVVAIAGAYDHSLALKNNGTVAAWGDNTFGQATVPAGLNNVVAVAGGEYYSMALKNNGTVAAWGANILTQTNVPAGLNNVVTIAGGTYSSLALKNNGTVVAWGANFFGLTNVPASASNAVAVAGGGFHSLAIKNNGTVITWGDNSAGQLNLPAGLTNVVAIAGGNYHSLALKNDGTVEAWGDDSAGQTNVPAGLNNVVAIAAGGFHSMALKSDGNVVAWGDDSAGQTNVPAGLNNVVAIAGGNLHSLALTPLFNVNPTNPVVLNLTNGVSQTSTVGANGIVYYRVNVLNNADFATNILLFALNGPLNVWFSTNAPPSITTLLLAGVTNGSSILSTSSAPTNIVPGAAYYLGVQNTNSFAVTYGIEVDFHLVTSTNPAPELPVQGTRVLYPLNPLIVTNTATDAAVPPPTLSYALTSTVTGANVPVINTNTGVITWTPDVSQSGTSNSLTTIVTASGVPPLSATNTFAVIVNPLPDIGSVTYTNGGYLLTWFAPSNDLFQVEFTATLASATWIRFTNIISYNTNAFTNPTNTQFNFFDDGVEYPFTGLRFYRLILLGLSGSAAPSSNTPPVLPVQATRTVNPLAALVVTNTATDVDAPPQTLTYTLSSTVIGTNVPVINPNTGVITWTPTLAQAGTSNTITTVVTDNGVPPMSATNTFSVIVNPLPDIGSVTYTNGGYRLTWFAPTNDLFRVEFTDNLGSPSWQSFSNIVAYTGPVTATNGLFSFYDDGSQYPFIGLRFYRIILLGLSGPAAPSSNTPPVLPVQATRTVTPLAALVVTNTATDVDAPPQTLTYTLSSTVIGTNVPVINPNTGVITWTPTLAQAGTSNTITTVVTDNGVPPMSATNAFAVIVNPLPDIGSVTYTNGSYLLTWWAPTNDLFQVQFTDGLPPTWQSFSNIIAYTGPVTTTNGLFTFLDDGTQHPFTGLRFYRLILLGVGSSPTNPPPVLPPVLPFPTNRIVNPLNPLVVTNTATDAAVPAPTLTYTLTSTVTGTNVPVINPTNGVITWTPDVLQAGTSNVLTTIVTASGVPVLSATNVFAVIVNPLPDIGSVTATNGNYLLTWFAPTNDLFQVQFKDNLLATNWQSFSNIITYTGPVTTTNGLFTFLDDGTQYPFTGLRFYRLKLVGLVMPANPPPVTNTVSISSIVFTNSSFRLAWSAPTNDQFKVQWATNIVPPFTWNTFSGIITSTNGIFSFTDTNAPWLMKFYQLVLSP